jgi:SAM-dependent methyltransferase
MSGMKEHWASVYGSRPADRVSWFQPRLESSLKLIAETGLKSGKVIDVGGGASTLADDLAARGFEVTVLDISAEALRISRERMGKDAAKVRWIEADIIRADLPKGFYDLWHDRALFHFLTDPADRRKYVETLRGSLKPGGHAILAAFDLSGPEKCSGLDVVRYSPETLARELGAGFRLVGSLREAHRTPAGAIQNFVYCRFSRTQIGNTMPAWG